MSNWALILGASSGIGASCARELAKKGVNIYGVYLRKKSNVIDLFSFINLEKPILNDVGYSMLNIEFLVNKSFKTPVKSMFLGSMTTSFKSASSAFFKANLIPFFSISFLDSRIPAVSETITG